MHDFIEMVEYKKMIHQLIENPMFIINSTRQIEHSFASQLRNDYIYYSLKVM